MAKTAETTMAEINDPAPDAPRADEESVMNRAREAGAEHAAAAKDAAAARASEEAERVREAAERFDAGSFAHAASERIADNLTQAAQSIRGADLSHLGDEVSGFARRQPLLFFGGAALLGFAAGRMLKASERAEHDAHPAGSFDHRGV